jgi:hypothetical protein
MMCLALVASASANWAIEGKALSSGQKESVAVSATGNFDFTTKVLGTTLTVTATSVTCSGTCTIDQAGTVELIEGNLSFGGMTIDTPSGCKIPSSITTNALTGELIMDPSGGTATFVKFRPTSGETIFSMTISECAAAGTYPLKGTFAGRMNNTGVSATSQPFTFNAAEQTTGGGALKVGVEAATMTGGLAMKLSGSNVGKGWSGS